MKEYKISLNGDKIKREFYVTINEYAYNHLINMLEELINTPTYYNYYIEECNN